MSTDAYATREMVLVAQGHRNFMRHHLGNSSKERIAGEKGGCRQMPLPERWFSWRRVTATLGVTTRGTALKNGSPVRRNAA